MREYSLETEKRVAYESLDHLHPFGTIRDNHSDSIFISKLIAKGVKSVLDIGCAGGGFVKELLDNGVNAMGIEGSDINQRTKRAEWATIPNSLFTADATAPFTISQIDREEFPDAEPRSGDFDVVTCWEFFEHIEKEDLDGVLENIYNHTSPGSLLIGSISDFPSPHDGVELHRTREDLNFWIPLFEEYGFRRSVELEEYFSPNWVRHGTYNVVLERV